MAQLSEATIQMNFSNAVRQARRLENLAAELSRLSGNELSGSLQAIAGAWKGDSSNLFLQKGNNLARQISDSAAALRGAARDIRSIAQRTYNAEMRALELARAREV